MSQINILATLQNHCAVPLKSIFRGKDGTKLKIDYWIDNTLPMGTQPPISVKLKEVKEDGTVTYTKAGETIKTSAELIKEGKPVSKPQETKAKK
jgi:hypothetical protein